MLDVGLKIHTPKTGNARRRKQIICRGRTAENWLNALLFVLFAGGFLGGLADGLGLGQALLELVHTTGGINKFLLAGVERMALIANADEHGGFGGTRHNFIAASATN
ncbi:MAG: putative lipid-binding transport protein (Tim44 family) [Limisphaerales bacterium]|jgi:predicted lipid-binding transport protein (Tim44 family)